MESFGLILPGSGLLGIIGLSVALLRGRKATADLSRALEGCNRERQGLEKRLKPVLDAEEEAKRVRAAAEAEKTAIAQEVSGLKADAERFRQQYATGLQRYQQLETEVRSLEEDLENVAVGLYRPHFTYADCEAYKAAIERVCDKQKSMIKPTTRPSTSATRGGTGERATADSTFISQ